MALVMKKNFDLSNLKLQNSPIRLNVNLSRIIQHTRKYYHVKMKIKKLALINFKTAKESVKVIQFLA